jgi:hypothetical protein
LQVAARDAEVGPQHEQPGGALCQGDDEFGALPVGKCLRRHMAACCHRIDCSIAQGRYRPGGRGEKLNMIIEALCLKQAQFRCGQDRKV